MIVISSDLRPSKSPQRRVRQGRSVGAHRVGTRIARAAGSVGRGRPVKFKINYHSAFSQHGVAPPAPFLRVATGISPLTRARCCRNDGRDGRMPEKNRRRLPSDSAPSRHGRRLGPRRSQQRLRRAQRRICAQNHHQGPYGVSARSEPEPFRLGGCATALGPSFSLASRAAVDAHLRTCLPDGWLV